ncbi:MAG: hypothetical protein ACYC6A_03455 [Armatimonadota bacterium]
MSRTIARFGFYSALLAFIASVGYDIVQILQVVGTLKYPVDAVLIYGFSLLIPVPFILAMLALHHGAADEKKIWTHAALLFIVIYAMYVTLNYVVQLAMVIPLNLRGELGELRILDQTPHSLFWNVDALGYIFMGLATLFAVPAFAKSGLEGWTRGFFLAHALVTPLIAFVYFYPTFSYRLLLLGAPWMITASGSLLLLALYFRSKRAAA